MARRTPPKAPKGRRDSKARSRKSAPAPESGDGGAEVIEEEKGMGIGDGITLATTVLLLAACLLTDYLLGSHYGAGLFFGG